MIPGTSAATRHRHAVGAAGTGLSKASHWDIVAVLLANPLAGCALDFNQQISAPSRAHKEERRELSSTPLTQFLRCGYRENYFLDAFLIGTVAIVWRMRLAIL